jgi:hypothetical protein
VVTVVVVVACTLRQEHAVDRMLSAILVRADGVAIGTRKLTARLPAPPPIVEVLVVVVETTSVVVVVVVVAVEVVSVDVVVVVVLSTSVEVVVVSVVVVVAAGVKVETVVEVPMLNNLLQNDVAGASSEVKRDKIALTSLHTLLTMGPIGELGVNGCPGASVVAGCPGRVGVTTCFEEEGRTGAPRWKRCNPNGVARTGTALRKSRTKVTTVESMINDRTQQDYG